MAKSNKYRGMSYEDRLNDVGAQLDEAIKLPKEVRRNALINSVKASDLASTGEGHAGATVNVNTFHLAEPGESAFFVGGEKDTAGNQIPTSFIGGSKEPGGVARNAPFVSPLSVLQHAARIRNLTGGRENANLGLWLDPRDKRSGVQADASAGYSTEAAAVEALADRPQEKSGWSMEKMDSFKNPAYDATKDPKSKRYKGE